MKLEIISWDTCTLPIADVLCLSVRNWAMPRVRIHLTIFHGLFRAYAGVVPADEIRLAFGSCNALFEAWCVYSEDRLGCPLSPSQPVWEGVINRDPQTWIWLGDNIYADRINPLGYSPRTGTWVMFEPADPEETKKM